MDQSQGQKTFKRTRAADKMEWKGGIPEKDVCRGQQHKPKKYCAQRKDGVPMKRAISQYIAAAAPIIQRADWRDLFLSSFYTIHSEMYENKLHRWYL